MLMTRLQFEDQQAHCVTAYEYGGIYATTRPTHDLPEHVALTEAPYSSMFACPARRGRIILNFKKVSPSGSIAEVCPALLSSLPV
jgi:hypothetical protein